MSERPARDERLGRLLAEARTDMRAWVESGEEDVGLALVELLALVGDLLSSYQDLVASEAYLGDARRRASVRVEVAGERWHRRRSLAASGPDDHDYVLVTEEGGGVAIQFGDGEHGQRPATGSEIGVRYRSGSGGAGDRFVSVRLQEGRVAIDSDWNDPAGTVFGLYRAVVTDNVDPLLTRRVRVRIPDILGDGSVWAVACLPADGSNKTPAIGDRVWVALEAGDPDRPVWLGQLFSVP